MTKIDPRLKYLQTQKKTSLRALAPLGRFGLEIENVPSSRVRVRVLVQFSGNPADLEKVGLEITSTAGDVMAGVIDLDKVEALAQIATVSRIESSRPLRGELDVSIPEIRANLVHTGPPGHRGTGVIVGIIDSGIDWQHESFRRQDNTSRILRIWDQGLTPQGNEQNPQGFTYGVEYTKADIDSALTSPNPAQVVRHRDGDTITGHGTHVVGIAAGDGSVAGNNQPAFTFVGVAPEADIIVVANAVTTQAIGDSANTLDGMTYIFNQAAALNRPVVINMSQGDNLGPHDGTSLLERGIDNLLGGQGRAFVKSAGNEGSNNRHASGTVVAGVTEQVRFNIPNNDITPDTIDIWYAGADRLAFSITPPNGVASAIVNPGNTQTLNLPNGNSVFVDSVLNAPNNNDNNIFLQLARGTANAIEPGNWTINLTGTTVTNGQFHAWIERGNITVAQFLAPHVNNEITISIPGTAREVITAASYITRGAGVGSISNFSSRGPTRDGRAAPTIAAPGQSIMSARAQGITSGIDQYHLLAGTSMSAPHVTGVIALMLQANPNLTQVQIRDCLTTTARSDAFTGTTPNATWGAGKIDAQTAFQCVSPPKLKFQDDQPTIKFLDEPGPTLKFNDEPGPTIKFLDEPGPTLKFNDEPGPTLKFNDEPGPTLKFNDEPGPTLKFNDEPGPTIKFNDEPGPTLKFRDEPGPTLKFNDEPGTSPTLDPIKLPALDKQPSLDIMKQPGGDLGTPPVVPGRPSGTAPFTLATPHHSMAWAQSYPEAFAAMLADYKSRIEEYEKALIQIDALSQRGQLPADQLQQAEALYQEYQILLAEFQILTQGAQGQQ